ncbi:hypothetical protein WJX72_008677 [[Myrmecia] bisecta]|uniref:J domain-containing protein n=1 Tax=[Myrmecia] bisecta TaxID=41462 RepID=A0AAW1P639_9CHLO
MESDEAELEEEASYYAVLNVSKEATDEDIKRAYRQLAQTYHPDKSSDPELQAQASAHFTRLQAAYEVLSDPRKREIYDVYGLEGLGAGLEVSDHLKTREEIRSDWERFKAERKERELEAAVNYRGVYIFKVDAADLVAPYDKRVSRAPEITQVAMTSQVQAPLTDDMAATFGGQVFVRRNVGGGSFICGIKRVISAHDVLEVHAMAGLKSLVSVQSTRQLSQYSSASLAASWQPGGGVGLQLLTTRQLTPSTAGELTWTVGPREAAGMALGITRRTDKFILNARIEVGAMTGLTGKCIWQASEKSTRRISFKFGTMGVEVEVGLAQRISAYSTAGMAVSVGFQGIAFKAQFTRDRHQFIFPVLVSSSPRDYHILLASYLVPPLTAYLVSKFIIRPLARRRKVQKALAARRDKAGRVAEGLRAVQAANQLMQPVAQRKLLKEAEKSGLVIVDAKYGDLEAILGAEKAAIRRRTVSVEAEMHATGSQGPAGGVPEQAQPTSRQSPGQPEGGATASEAGSETDEAMLAAVAEALEREALPDPWIDVTTATRFMVENSLLTFHPGIPKSGLMGFCDVAPGAAKNLRIRFLWRNNPYVTVLAEQEAGQLPSRGSLVTAPADVRDMLFTAAASGVSIQQPDSTGWTDCAVYSPHDSR